MDAVRIFELVAARLPDATLTLVGDGKGAEEVRQYLDERPTLAASVRLPGKTGLKFWEWLRNMIKTV